MAGGFSILDNLNENSKQNMNDTVKACFRTKNIPIKNIRKNKKNFYEIKDIEKLANEIQMVGLLENLTVVYSPDKLTNTEYKLIGGERRLQALELLVEKGFEEFNTVTCNIRNASTEDEEMIDLIICNSQRKKSTYELLLEASRLKIALTNLKETGGTIRGVDISKGRLRDIVAKLLNISNTKAAQIDNINNNLIDSFTRELKNEKITFSAANELAGLSEEKQLTLYEDYKINGEITLREIRNIKDELKEEQIKVEDEVTSAQIQGQISAEETLNNISYYDLQNNYLSLGMSFFDYQAISILIKEAQEDTILYLTDTFEIDVDISKLENEETNIEEANRVLDKLYITLKDLDEKTQKFIIETFMEFYKHEKEIIRTDKQIESEDINLSNEDDKKEAKEENIEIEAELEIISDDKKNKMIDNFIEAFHLEDDLLVKRHNIEWLIEDLRCIEKMDALKKDVFNRLAISLYTPRKHDKKVPRLVKPLLNDFIEKMRFKSERTKWKYICDLLSIPKDVHYEKIPRAKTKKEKMINVLYTAKVNHYDYIGIEIKKGNEEPDFIINKYKSIDNKINYYMENYTDDLTLKDCKDIRIIKISYEEKPNDLIKNLEGYK